MNLKKFCLFVLIFLCVFPSVLQAQQRSEKRGLAFGHLQEGDLMALSKGLSWWYNWYVTPESGVIDCYEKYDMDFVPMLWNGSSDTTKLRAFLKSHPNVKYILGFNEPNFKTQANMTPVKVAANWKRIEDLADEFNLKIVGPAVNYCDQCVDIPGTTQDSDPYVYLDAFFEACPDCRVDYIAVHNYMCYTSALSSYIEGFYKYGKKIWLTEFACWDQPSITLNMQENLVLSAIEYLENDTNVFRYAWFTGGRDGAWPYLDILDSETGELTELGNLYVNYYPVHDTSRYDQIPARIEAESYSAMSGVQLEITSDFDGMANVGYFDAGDWLQYNVVVPETKEYQIYMRIASNAATDILVKDGDSVLVQKAIPSSGGWQSWKNYQVSISLEEGKHDLVFTTTKGSLNLNWIAFLGEKNHAPVADAGCDQTIALPSNSVGLVASASDEDNNNLVYKWTRVSGKSTCVIESPNSANTYVSSLEKGKYVFKVTVSDGIETVSDLVTVLVNGPTSSEPYAKSAIRIFPNPANDRLSIEIGSEEYKNEMIDIFSIDGRLMTSVALDAPVLSVDVQGFDKGVYLLRIRNRVGLKPLLFIKGK